MNTVIQLIAAFLGAFGFAFVFDSKIKYAIIGSIGGVCAWGIFLFADIYSERVFFACLFAWFFAAFFSEICAKLLKAPATVFFIPAIIPLVPGSALYTTIANVVKSDWQGVGKYAFLTAEYAFAIAIGASFVWGVRRIFKRVIKARRKRIL